MIVNERPSTGVQDRRIRHKQEMIALLYAKLTIEKRILQLRKDDLSDLQLEAWLLENNR